MADVENLDFAPGFADTIVGEKWAVEQLADVCSLSNQATHPWKASE